MRTLICISGWAFPATDHDPDAIPLPEDFSVVHTSPAELLRAGMGSAEPGAPGSVYCRGLAHIVNECDEPYAIMGWSMGAIIACEAVCKLDLTVDRLVLLSATARFCADAGYPCGVPVSRVRAMKAGLRRDPDAVLRAFYADVFFPDAIPDSQLHARIHETLKYGIDEAAHGLQYLIDTDLRECAGKLSIPVLIAHGGQDRIIPADAGERLARIIPGSAFIRCPDAGHRLRPDGDSLGRGIGEFIALCKTHAGSGRSVSARFDAAAETYDSYSAIQTMTARAVHSLAASLPTPRRILEIGCGTGILTRMVRTGFPSADFHALDISASMVRRTQLRLENPESVTWHVCDLLAFTDPEPFDCICSSSALHWIVPVTDAFDTISRLLSDQGHLVFGIMIDGTLQQLRAARLIAAPHKIPQARLPGSAEILAACDRNGLRCVNSFTETHTIMFPSATSMLAALHRQGLTGGSISHAESLLNRSELRTLAGYYDDHFRAGPDMVYATYHVMYGIAARKGGRL
jgi:malonyl-CoA O-methyltransferase